MLVFKESRRWRISVSLRARGRRRGPCDPPRLKPWYLGRRRRGRSHRHLLRNSAKPTIWPPLSLSLHKALVPRPRLWVKPPQPTSGWLLPRPLSIGKEPYYDSALATTCLRRRSPAPFPLFLFKPVFSLIWLSWTYNKPVNFISRRTFFYQLKEYLHGFAQNTTLLQITSSRL